MPYAVLDPNCFQARMPSAAELGKIAADEAPTSLLTGAPNNSRQWLCPKCNAKKLAEHVQRWEQSKQAAVQRTVS